MAVLTVTTVQRTVLAVSVQLDVQNVLAPNVLSADLFITGVHFVSIRVSTVQAAANLMDVLPVAIVATLSMKTLIKEVMNVNRVDQHVHHVPLTIIVSPVAQSIGEPRVNILVLIRVQHVHQIHHARHVYQGIGEVIVKTAALDVIIVTYAVSPKGV